GRPSNMRREHARRVAHDQAKAWIATIRHRDKQDAAGGHIGGLERDAIDRSNGVRIRAEGRRDADERLAIANDVNGRVYRRDDDGLTWAQLRGVLYPVVVGERLRRDPVGRRDREKRLTRRDRVDLKAWRVLAQFCDRRASRDDDRPFERTR